MGEAAETEGTIKTEMKRESKSNRMDFMKKSLAWVVVGCLIIAGMAVTVIDYRQWRKLETANYGKGADGSSQLLPAGELVNYKNDVAKFRVKYPEGWTVAENPKFLIRGEEKITWEDIVKSGERTEVVKFSHPIAVHNVRPEATIYITKTDKGMSDIADARVAERLSRGLNPMADREYMRVGDNDMTVIAWDEANVIHQITLVKRDGRLLEIEATAAAGKEWEAWAKTFAEMRNNWFIF